MNNTPNDFEWLKSLDEAIWVHHERKANAYGYSSEKRLLMLEEKRRVVDIFERYRNELCFCPGAGVFGFGVSITAYAPPEFPQVPPTRLISLTDRHLLFREDKDNKAAYAFIESFTHTDRNKELRSFCGFKEKLQPMSYYDY